MRLLAIDPGLRKLGCAVFEEGVLVRAFEVLRETDESFDRDVAAWRRTVDALEEEIEQAPDRLVMEMMHVTPGDRGQEAKINNLLQLVGVVGMLGGRFRCEVHSYRPMNIKIRDGIIEGWKASTPKKQHQRRILKRLSRQEMSLLPFTFDDYMDAWRACRKGEAPVGHDMVDAIGIGIHDLDRWDAGPPR